MKDNTQSFNNLVHRTIMVSAYWDSWQLEKTSDIAFGLLSNIGHLERNCIDISALKDIRIEIRKDLKHILEFYGKYMENSNLCEIANNLLTDHKNEDLLIDYYQNRDEIQLAWCTAWDYIRVSSAKNIEPIYKARKIWTEADNIILFNKEVVDSLREIGDQESKEHCDLEYFWWLDDKEDCYLPQYRRDEFMAEYLDNLSDNLNYNKHILTCNDCTEQIKRIKEEGF